MPTRQRILNIINQRGLHARASAKLVKIAEKFSNNSITAEKDGEIVSALSIMGLMMLGASLGTQIIITASGEGADIALDAIEELINNKFDEEI